MSDSTRGPRIELFQMDQFRNSCLQHATKYRGCNSVDARAFADWAESAEYRPISQSIPALFDTWSLS